jgi:LPXTG-site transpeptidase (sortase) family protein
VRRLTTTTALTLSGMSLFTAGGIAGGLLLSGLGAPAPLPAEAFTEAAPASVRGDGWMAPPRPLGAERLLIPAIDVDAPIVDSTIDNGLLTIPEHSEVGRYVGGGSVRSENGTVLLAGHVSSYGHPGALRLLSRLRAGDWVYLSDEDGNLLGAVVTGVEVRLKADLPDGLFTSSGERRVVLVTCGGEVVTRSDGTRHYASNVIVTAVPVQPRPVGEPKDAGGHDGGTSR